MDSEFSTSLLNVFRQVYNAIHSPFFKQKTINSKDNRNFLHSLMLTITEIRGG